MAQPIPTAAALAHALEVDLDPRARRRSPIESRRDNPIAPGVGFRPAGKLIGELIKKEDRAR